MFGHVAGLPTRPNARLRSITALIAAAVHQARLTRLVRIKQLPAQPPATLYRGVKSRPPTPTCDTSGSVAPRSAENESWTRATKSRVSPPARPPAE